MQRLLSLVLSAVLLTVIAGCQGEMHDVMTLPAMGADQPPQMMTVTEKGTYYLYSSKDPKTSLFRKDLKKGDQIGFSVHGDRARALAAGTIVQLDDYSEGTSYVWKLEEKKKD
jgi:hypothetical protein